MDLLGGQHLNECIQSVALGGTVVIVGLMGGSRAELDLWGLMRARARIIGTVLRSRPLEEKIALARQFEERLVPLFERGLLTPFVDSVLPLEQAAEAHRRMERNEHLGKIVLRLEA